MIPFILPDDLTTEQMQELFGHWATFVEEAKAANHTVRTDCEGCINEFTELVDKVRGLL